MSYINSPEFNIPYSIGDINRFNCPLCNQTMKRWFPSFETEATKWLYMYCSNNTSNGYNGSEFNVKLEMQEKSFSDRESYFLLCNAAIEALSKYPIIMLFKTNDDWADVHQVLINNNDSHISSNIKNLIMVAEMADYAKKLRILA